jgi:hypothetical protein
MGWKLELVETGQGPASRRIAVARLGEIGAPASVEDIGLDHSTAQRMPGDIQHAVLAHRERGSSAAIACRIGTLDRRVPAAAGTSRSLDKLPCGSWADRRVIPAGIGWVCGHGGTAVTAYARIIEPATSGLLTWQHP